MPNWCDNTVTITADEFAKTIVESQINSVGKFETIYADFAQYVDEFLNYAAAVNKSVKTGAQIGGQWEQLIAFLNFITGYLIIGDTPCKTIFKVFE